MPESAKKSLVVFMYCVLISSTLLVFLQVGNFDFVNYDDEKYVYANPQVSNGLSRDGIVWAFTTGHASNWHPLTWLSHMLDYQLFGRKPGWMHLVNVLLHIANTLLLFTVLRKMTGALWQSVFVAAAFALHPMHVESVAWIAERKDVLSTLFLLLTLVAYVGYVKRPSVFRYVITLALFALGLMAKPMLVTLPFILLLIDYWPLDRFDTRPRKPAPTGDGGVVLYRIIIEKIPFFVLAAASSVITFLVQRAGGSVADITVIPPRIRVANAFLSYAEYIGKMFWPENLAVFYPLGTVIFVLSQVMMCVLLLIVISIFVILFGRRRRYLPMGWFWFIGTLLPVIGLVQVGDQAYADRYTYIPYIGLFIMIAWGLPELLSKWPQRRIVLGIVAAMVLTALAICAHRQVSYWNNSIALYCHAIEVTPNNYLAYNNRGGARIASGRLQEAAEDLREAVRINPGYADAHYNLGVAYNSLGRGAEAIDAYKQAIRINPNNVDGHNNLGIAYGGLGRWQEAVGAYEQAIKIEPGFAKAYNNLGIAYVELGRSAEAIDAYKQAIKIKPNYAEAYNNYAWLIATNPRVKNRDTGEAIRLAERACELKNYKGPVLLGTLAAAYASAGRFTEAVDTANTALKLAEAAKEPQIKDIIQYHLSFYTQGKPYIEQGSVPLLDSGKP